MTAKQAAAAAAAAASPRTGGGHFPAPPAGGAASQPAAAGATAAAPSAAASAPAGAAAGPQPAPAPAAPPRRRLQLPKSAPATAAAKPGPAAGLWAGPGSAAAQMLEQLPAGRSAEHRKVLGTSNAPSQAAKAAKAPKDEAAAGEASEDDEREPKRPKVTHGPHVIRVAGKGSGGSGGAAAAAAAGAAAAAAAAAADGGLAAGASGSGATTRHPERWLTEPDLWKSANSIPAANQLFAAALKDRRSNSSKQIHSDLEKHMRYIENPAAPLSGAPVALTLKAFERAGKLRDSNGRPHAHSDDVAAAARDSLCGPVAGAVFAKVALGIEEQHPGMQVTSLQMIVNEPGASSTHQDSGGEAAGSGGGSDSVCVGSGSGCRVIARCHVLLDPVAAKDHLGSLAITPSSSGAGGGVLLDLSTGGLSCSKPILGKESRIYHQVVVYGGGTASCLAEADPKEPSSRKRKRPGALQAFLQAYRDDPQLLELSPVSPEQRAVLGEQYPNSITFASAGSIPRLHSHSAAGTVGGTRSMAIKGKDADGASTRAREMGEKGGAKGGSTAWQNNPEAKRQDAIKGAKAAGKKAAAEGLGAMSDPARYGSENATADGCLGCTFRSCEQAGTTAEKLIPCCGICKANPLPKLLTYQRNRLRRKVKDGDTCDAALLADAMGEKSNKGGKRKGAGRKKQAATAPARAVKKKAANEAYRAKQREQKQKQQQQQ
ncbi:hypothetical protein ABPG75_010632 [Micractinium tetrahymenae]